MNRSKFKISLLHILFLVGCIAKVNAQIKIPNAVKKQLKKVDTTRIEKHVTYLADDKLMGRYATAPGYILARDYVANQLNTYGIKPQGENGTYFQKVVLREAKVEKGSVQITAKNKDASELTIDQNSDFILFPHPDEPKVNLTSDLVFVGAGNYLPAYGIDDYKNIDVNGKIVVILAKIPDQFSLNVKRHLSYAANIQEVAVKKGAKGVLICNATTTPASFALGIKRMQTDGLKLAVDTKGKRAASSQLYGHGLQIYANISVSFLRKILANNPTPFEEITKKVEAGGFASTPLSCSMSISYNTIFNDGTSYNVLGKIEGSDPKLSQEYVIHSAHLDHIGITTPVKGDSINNGAHDNASGVASLLEIAKTYAGLKTKPKRSILFLFCTAEEWGLLGSAYFANNPTAPLGNIVADINTDMPTLIAPLESLAPLGAEHSTMWNTVEQAAKYLKIKVEPDPDPAEYRFVRSDQYSFLKVGIPAIHIKYGYKYANPALNLAEKVKVFRENHYHKVSDQIDLGFNWSAAKTYVQSNFLVSYIIAQTAVKPSFLKGDFFEKKQ